MTERTVKYCVHCGDRVYQGQIYCPRCGKLNLQMKPTREGIQQKPTDQKKPILIKRDISRKCTGCGSVISSTILEQCPICDELLEPVSDEHKKQSQQPLGLVFLDRPRASSRRSKSLSSRKQGKLVPEESLILKNDSWIFKEGFNVFTNSLMVYITLELLIIMLLWVGIDPDAPLQIEMNIFTILISQVPGIVFGIYAIGYILSHKHTGKKLGLNSNGNKLILALLIGAAGAFGLLGINFFSSFFNSVLNDIGLPLFDITAHVAEENTIIIESGPLWITLLGALLCLQAVSIEIVYRGVLHNTLKQRFEDSIIGRAKVILLVSSVYSLIYLLFSFPIGIVFLLLNFLLSLFLGFLYEITRNLYTTIAANCAYNILLLIVIIFF